MTFNPLKEKGLPIEKQVRTWKEIASRKYNKNDVDCYSRTRQILMNGIEVETWNFKHNMARNITDSDTLEFLAQTKRIEDAQQTTVNWLAPCDQSVLETTLAYEQVAVDLTAWMAQNEPDPYVKETFDLRPAAIINHFNLRGLPAKNGGKFYQLLAAYGHMGRVDIDVPWEKLDKVSALKDAVSGSAVSI